MKNLKTDTFFLRVKDFPSKNLFFALYWICSFGKLVYNSKPRIFEINIYGAFQYYKRMFSQILEILRPSLRIIIMVSEPLIHHPDMLICNTRIKVHFNICYTLFSCVSNSMNWKFTKKERKKERKTYTKYVPVWPCMVLYGTVWSQMVKYGPV